MIYGLKELLFLQHHARCFWRWTPVAKYRITLSCIYQWAVRKPLWMGIPSTSTTSKGKSHKCGVYQETAWQLLQILCTGEKETSSLYLCKYRAVFPVVKYTDLLLSEWDYKVFRKLFKTCKHFLVSQAWIYLVLKCYDMHNW